MTPLLTIITVVRNDQRGLDLTMASVRDEAPFAEHLIVDGSDAPLRTPSDAPRLRVIHGRDRGIAHAFNRGLVHSTGRYVLFINAGDCLMTASGTQLEAKLSEQDADCLWFSVYRVGEHGRKSIYRPRLHLLKYAMSAPHQGMVVKRDVFAEIGLFPLQRYSMDHHLALRLICRWPAYEIQAFSDVIADYPVGGHSSQGGLRPFAMNCWNVARVRPALLPAAMLANAYLASKSIVVRCRRRAW